MTKWYKAITMKEIYWKGQTYRSGDEIKLIENDVVILTDAGIIGAIEKIESKTRKEFAVKDVQENQKVVHKKRGRKPKNENQSLSLNV